MASSRSLFEQEWPNIEAAYIKLKNNPEGLCEPPFNPEEQIKLFSCIYNLSSQPDNYQEKLYYKYQDLVKDYNKETLLPSLRDKQDEYLLRELVKKWSDNKVMLRWLFRIFNYIERYYVPRCNLPKLNDIGITTFRDMVYQEMKSKVRDAVLALIYKEREGEEIDRALLKNVIDVYCEIGMGHMEKYKEDFESFFLQDTASYYSLKASKWIQEDSCPEYMIKAEECLKLEKERATNYLHSITKTKLVEIVQKELLVVVAKQLIENEYSGFHVLLRNDKMDDISRMFRLYNPIPQELESIAILFKEHVVTEGNALIQQDSDAATSGVQDQVLIKKLTERRDKYMVYVDECFQKHTLFSKALEEAFEVFPNKTVAQMSSADIPTGS